MDELESAAADLARAGQIDKDDARAILEKAMREFDLTTVRIGPIVGLFEGGVMRSGVKVTYPDGGKVADL